MNSKENLSIENLYINFVKEKFFKINLFTIVIVVITTVITFNLQFYISEIKILINDHENIYNNKLFINNKFISEFYNEELFIDWKIKNEKSKLNYSNISNYKNINNLNFLNKSNLIDFIKSNDSITMELKIKDIDLDLIGDVYNYTNFILNKFAKYLTTSDIEIDKFYIIDYPTYPYRKIKFINLFFVYYLIVFFSFSIIFFLIYKKK